jgi:hypothetical protein
MKLKQNMILGILFIIYLFIFPKINLLNYKIHTEESF